MAGTRKLTVEILGDAKGLAGTLKDADGHLSTFASKVGDIAKKTAIGLAGLGVGAVAIAKPLIGAAADLAETQSKVNVLFGEGADEVDAFAKTAAKRFGQSKQQALDAAATFATFGKAAGLSGKQLSTFSTDFVGLASDLASFNNTSPEDAIDAIGAALRGEAEPMRRYGVLLDDASMRQEAVRLGLIKTTKEALTPQQKVLAAQALIYKQTGAAQGDFARTSDGLANQSRILKAQLSNVQAEIGQKLLPVALTLATFANDKLVPAIEKLIAVFDEQGLSGVLKVVGSALKDAAGVLWQWIVDVTPDVLAKLWEWTQALGAWLRDTGLPWLGQKLGEGARWLWQWIKDVTPDVLKALAELSMKMGEWFGEQAPKWAAQAADFVKQLPALIAALASQVDWFGLLFDAGTKMSQGMAAGFMVGPGAFLIGLAKGTGVIGKGNLLNGVEGRAFGGPVTAGTPYLVGERGVPELFVPRQSGTVVPMENMGGGGVNVYVNALDSSSITPQLARKLGDSIRRELTAVR